MIRKNHFFITVFTLMFYSASLQAQQDTLIAPETPAAPEKEKIPFKDRLFLGGNLGLQFGSQTYIDVSPLLGYRVNDKLSVGVGATYIYYRLKEANYSYSSSIYGGRMFARYFLYENFFAQFEPELLNMEVYNTNSNEYYRKNIFSPFIGGGYIQKFSEYSGIYIMLLYNINDTPDSPYQNPVIRIGFNIGL